MDVDAPVPLTLRVSRPTGRMTEKATPQTPLHTAGRIAERESSNEGSDRTPADLAISRGYVGGRCPMTGDCEHVECP